MSRNFVVVVENPTPEEGKLITEYLQESGCGWWHWIHNFWFAVEPEERLTTSAIRQKIQELIPDTKNILVLKVGVKDSWASWAPEEAHDWLKKYWKP